MNACSPFGTTRVRREGEVANWYPHFSNAQELLRSIARELGQA